LFKDGFLWRNQWIAWSRFAPRRSNGRGARSPGRDIESGDNRMPTFSLDAWTLLRTDALRTFNPRDFERLPQTSPIFERPDPTPSSNRRT
jgi:hypothetical protein